MKKLLYSALVIAFTFSAIRCSESYLDEESYGPTVAVFETEEGSESLVHLLYKKLNVYGGTFSLGFMTENGADTWLRGKNAAGTPVTDYLGLDANSADVAWYWNHFYKALWNCNLFLETYPDMVYSDPKVKEGRKGEVLTLQAFFLWHVTEQWGDTYLPKSTDVEEGLRAERSTREDFYNRIIANLEEAITILPPKTNELGRVDQGVAKALLTRIYLYHGDWQKAADMAEDVIKNHGYALEPSWTALWDETKKVNKEFIWTAEFSDDDAFGAGGSWYWQAYAMHIDRFAGVKTELGYTGFGGCQIMPSKYYISLFNQEADLRWSQGHQWAWLYNDPADDTSVFPEMKTLYSDTALYLYTGVLTAGQRAAVAHKYTVFDMNDMYDAAGVPKDRGTFIGLTKFDDQTRPSDLSNISARNYPIIRLGEIYLIAAEAQLRLGAAGTAAQYINDLRARVITPGHEAEMTVSDADMSIDFILDERGRELGGEFQRWYDLKRTGKLLERVRAYNPDAAPNIQDHHLVRPIPQPQFDGMPDPETLGQNPEY
ncbi:RagB/SusD family nutrient uptake outer membrane protein [Fulvivirgaceae bacterium PWU5]|uniref:RagB/SusD family nutrient uptake outer membrane protein n=1 Tax=Dawidia cretensis TaxID=2782350 RepID=A0AAP2E1T3_9BACT|nr:RagB/SusD family nutrient uptake outer membrane protein [Dawidia cretensis]MBT1710087.1 RagB/SusD family nutrient uptake outer membrane protein [Dawidia cretensis]